MTESNANTVQEQDLQQFIPEQIEDCCENLEGMSIVLRDATQIIRQLERQLQEAGDRLEGEGLRR